MNLNRIYVKKQDYQGVRNYVDALKTGSCFNEVYKPYTNIKVDLTSSNKRDELSNIIKGHKLLQLDLTLYLDVYPDCKRALADLVKVNNVLNEYTTRYVKEYGPLTINDQTSTEEYNYINNPWPWEV